MSIGATPFANFGQAYYCTPEADWPEACAAGRRAGPVTREGHPQRLACEQQFLEAPCPTFSMDRCTGVGVECPITFDPFLIIDGVNQNHPSNVRAGCSEDYVKDPDGHPLWGEWWWATAHGKGYVRACNFDGSVCGISSFEIDQ